MGEPAGLKSIWFWHDGVEAICFDGPSKKGARGTHAISIAQAIKVHNVQVSEIERLRARLATAISKERWSCDGTLQCRGCEDCTKDIAAMDAREAKRLMEEWDAKEVDRGV